MSLSGLRGADADAAFEPQAAAMSNQGIHVLARFATRSPIGPRRGLPRGSARRSSRSSRSSRRPPRARTHRLRHHVPPPTMSSRRPLPQFPSRSLKSTEHSLASETGS
jgi:hypothetical protein